MPGKLLRSSRKTAIPRDVVFHRFSGGYAGGTVQVRPDHDIIGVLGKVQSLVEQNLASEWRRIDREENHMLVQVAPAEGEELRTISEKGWVACMTLEESGLADAASAVTIHVTKLDRNGEPAEIPVVPVGPDGEVAVDSGYESNSSESEFGEIG